MVGVATAKLQEPKRAQTGRTENRRRVQWMQTCRTHEMERNVCQ